MRTERRDGRDFRVTTLPADPDASPTQALRRTLEDGRDYTARVLDIRRLMGAQARVIA